MTATVVGVGDPKAVKKYSAILAVDIGTKSYWSRKFMGRGASAQAPIQILQHLENDAGDTISYDLVMQLRMQPVEGDDTLRGKEENLNFFTDEIKIDQLRGGVNTGGKMTRKRTVHVLRDLARARESDWWARIYDELFFMYLSGSRGVNADYTFPTSYAGFAGNPITAPDDYHLIFQNGKTKSTIAAVTNGLGGDGMTLDIIDQAVARATTMGGGTAGIPAMEPVMINGEEHYVTVMHPFQEFCVRKTSGAGQWIDIQKAAATAEGKNNPIFKGSLGMYNNVVLHTHKNVIRFDDYGAGTVTAARALFLGRQAAVVAFGSSGNDLRFDWNEELEDRGNQVVITTSAICGVKKTSFVINGTRRDFGVISLDTACGDPSNAGL